VNLLKLALDRNAAFGVLLHQEVLATLKVGQSVSEHQCANQLRAIVVTPVACNAIGSAISVVNRRNIVRVRIHDFYVDIRRFGFSLF
jgi:hypothetical protein